MMLSFRHSLLASLPGPDSSWLPPGFRDGTHDAAPPCRVACAVRASNRGTSAVADRKAPAAAAAVEPTRDPDPWLFAPAALDAWSTPVAPARWQQAPAPAFGRADRAANKTQAAGKAQAAGRAKADVAAAAAAAPTASASARQPRQQADSQQPAQPRSTQWPTRSKAAALAATPHAHSAAAGVKLRRQAAASALAEAKQLRRAVAEAAVATAAVGRQAKLEKREAAEAVMAAAVAAKQLRRASALVDNERGAQRKAERLSRLDAAPAASARKKLVLAGPQVKVASAKVVAKAAGKKLLDAKKKAAADAIEPEATFTKPPAACVSATAADVADMQRVVAAGVVADMASLVCRLCRADKLEGAVDVLQRLPGLYPFGAKPRRQTHSLRDTAAALEAVLSSCVRTQRDDVAAYIVRNAVAADPIGAWVEHVCEAARASQAYLYFKSVRAVLPRCLASGAAPAPGSQAGVELQILGDAAQQAVRRGGWDPAVPGLLQCYVHRLVTLASQTRGQGGGVLSAVPPLMSLLRSLVDDCPDPAAAMDLTHAVRAAAANAAPVFSSRRPDSTGRMLWAPDKEAEAAGGGYSAATAGDCAAAYALHWACARTVDVLAEMGEVVGRMSRKGGGGGGGGSDGGWDALVPPPMPLSFTEDFGVVDAAAGAGGGGALDGMETAEAAAEAAIELGVLMDGGVPLDSLGVELVFRGGDQPSQKKRKGGDGGKGGAGGGGGAPVKHVDPKHLCVDAGGMHASGAFRVTLTPPFKGVRGVRIRRGDMIRLSPENTPMSLRVGPGPSGPDYVQGCVTEVMSDPQGGLGSIVANLSCVPVHMLGRDNATGAAVQRLGGPHTRWRLDKLGATTPHTYSMQGLQKLVKQVGKLDPGMPPAAVLRHLGTRSLAMPAILAMSWSVAGASRTPLQLHAVGGGGGGGNTRGVGPPASREVAAFQTAMAGVAGTLVTPLRPALLHELRRPGVCNPSQEAAVCAAVSRRLTLVLGPPGTGKTHTIAHMLLVALQHQDAQRAAMTPKMRQEAPNHPILVAAETHVAVDNILRKLVQLLEREAARLPPPPPRAAWPSRSGSFGQAPPGAAAGRDGMSSWDNESSWDSDGEGGGGRGGGGGGGRGATHPLLEQGFLVRNGDPFSIAPDMHFFSDQLAMRAMDAQRASSGVKGKKSNGQAADKARVVFCTATGSGSMGEGRRFSLVVIDEAAQVTEPTSLIPIMRDCKQLVLVGDHRQLPPTVSDEAKPLGLQQPMFERLQAAGVVPHMLNTQYRMHPDIAAFSAAEFYGGALLNGPDVATRDGPLPAPLATPVSFIHVEGRESGARSKANVFEAKEVARLLDQLLAPKRAGGGGLSPQDIGIVTPYRGMVGELVRATGGAQAAGVYICSVDGFQGQEREVIIFSTVRANNHGNIGFLADTRRLNVALTRARRAIVVVGHRPTLLAGDPLWARWVGMADGNGNAQQAGGRRKAQSRFY